MKKLGFLCATIASLYGISKASAETFDITNPFDLVKEETEEEGLLDVVKYEFTQPEDEEASGTYQPTSYKVVKDRPQLEVTVPLASGTDKETGREKQFYTEHKNASYDWINVEYAHRDTDPNGDVVGNESLVFDNVLNTGDDENQQYFVISTEDYAYKSASEVAESDGDGKLDHFVVRNNENNIYRLDKKGDVVIQGVGAHIGDLSFNGKAMSNVVFEHNGAIMDISDDDIADMENRNANVRGAAIYVDVSYADADSQKNKPTISKLEGDFINNYVKAAGKYEDKINADGGAIYITGETRIGDSVDGKSGILNSLFEKNEAKRGGAIFNNKANISYISALFLNNQAEGTTLANGGAIYNEKGASNIGAIGTADDAFTTVFMGNSAKTTGSATDKDRLMGANGGAIFNNGTIGDIKALFINNSVDGVNTSKGGAIYNRTKDSDIGTIGNVTGYFVANKAHQGGAIANDGYMGDINGYFEENTGNGLEGKDVFGGAIANSMSSEDGVVTSGKMGDITASFYKNSITGNGGGEGNGGAIANTSGSSIGNIKGDFVQNSASASGGAIYNDGDESTIGAVEGDFIANSAGKDGGAIYNTATLSENGLQSEFFNNTAGHDGGAVYNGGTMGAIEGQFTYNSAKGNGGAVYNKGELALTGIFANNTAGGEGGALYNEEGGEVTFEGVNIFAENKSGSGLNDIYNDGTLTVARDGVLKLDSGIRSNVKTATLEIEAGGKVYSDEVTLIENAVINDGKLIVNGSNELTVGDKLVLNNGSALVLGSNALVQVHGDFVGSETAGVALDGNKAYLRLHLGIDDQGDPVTGFIKVDGDIVGTTHIIVTADSADKPNKAFVKFLEALNDTVKNQEAFVVDRVYASPYMWKAAYNRGGEKEGSHWYLERTDELNDNTDIDEDLQDEVDDFVIPHGPRKSAPIYTPEMSGFVAMHEVAMAQNRSINNSIYKGLSTDKSLTCRENKCGVIKVNPENQAWIQTSFDSATVKSPSEFDADISGVTMGVDLYRDYRKRAGMFGAYRSGTYDFNGKGDYRAAIGSQIKDKSYLGGLYYKYDNRDWSFFGTMYAGRQTMDMRTDDRIVQAKTHASQYGANAELSKSYFLMNRTYISPFAGLSYTMIDIDDMDDNVGKTAQFDVLHYAAIELGTKLEYLFCNDGKVNRLYVKPSVIRSFSRGGWTHVTGINDDIRTFKDRTMLRGELGGEWGFGSGWAGYLSAGYTTGDDYRAYDLTVGLNKLF